MRTHRKPRPNHQLQKSPKALFANDSSANIR
jgi:hypothetical protein